MLKRLLNLFSPSIKVISKLSPFMSSSKKIDQNRIVTSLFVGSDEHAVAQMVLTFAGTVVSSRITLPVSQFLCLPPMVDEMKAFTTS